MMKIGTKVKLNLSRSTLSDVKADLLANYQEHMFNTKQYSKLLEAVENPSATWIVCARDAYHKDTFFVALTKKGHQIAAYRKDMVKV